MATDKVKTAVFGSDLRVTLKQYPLSKNGNKIDIVNSGEAYFMPEIGPTSFLDWPSYKRFLLFGTRTYKRIYFTRKKAAKCVDFGNEEGIVYGPDEEQIKKANLNILATKIGQDQGITIPWYLTVILIVDTVFLFIIAHVLGVF